METRARSRSPPPATPMISAPAPSDVPDWLRDVFEPVPQPAQAAGPAGVEILFPDELYGRVVGKAMKCIKELRESCGCDVTVGLDGPSTMPGKCILGPGLPDVLHRATRIFLQHILNLATMMPDAPSFPGHSPFFLPQRHLSQEEMFTLNGKSLVAQPLASLPGMQLFLPSPVGQVVPERSSAIDGVIIKKDPRVAVPADEPTRVVLLVNLVPPGEVDEDFEEEISDEASKYGKLLKCMIKEREDAVRVFLEYEQLGDAQKAFKDFNGRYFGGRTVNARYFDVAAYLKGDV